MNARKLLTVAVAATVLLGGVAATAAAAPGNAPSDDHAPDDPGNGNAPDHPGSADAGNGSEAGNGSDAGNGSEAAPGEGNAGPPTDMPSVVPDKVTEIHETIQSFLDGGIDNLGKALSDLLGNDAGSASDASDAANDNASAPAA